jgi:hypothetical protein
LAKPADQICPDRLGRSFFLHPPDRTVHPMTMIRDTEPLLTGGVIRMIVEEAGAYVSESTVRSWQRRGLLKAQRTASGVYIYRASDVRKLLDRRRALEEVRGRGGRGEQPPDAA